MPISKAELIDFHEDKVELIPSPPSTTKFLWDIEWDMDWHKEFKKAQVIKRLLSARMDHHVTKKQKAHPSAFGAAEVIIILDDD